MRGLKSRFSVLLVWILSALWNYHDNFLCDNQFRNEAPSEICSNEETLPCFRASSSSAIAIVKPGGQCLNFSCFLQVAQRNQTRSRGDVSTKATQQASYETSRSNGSGPNDNLLALALAERQKAESQRLLVALQVRAQQLCDPAGTGTGQPALFHGQMCQLPF